MAGVDVVSGRLLRPIWSRHWTPTTREQHSRKALRYQTDLTDAEWVVIEPHLPPAHGTGRPRWPMREIVNGIFYVMRAGCPWRLLPSDHRGAIYRWFAKFRDEEDQSLSGHGRSRAGLSTARASRRPRLVAPAATMRARRSRSATRWSTPTGAASCSRRIRRVSRTRWWRAAAVRLTRLVSVHREGLCRQRLRRREGRHGHRDRRRDVRKSPDQVGFAVQPRRWVVERFFAWINRNRRLAKDFEATIASARAFLYAASIMLLVRRLARAA